MQVAYKFKLQPTPEQSQKLEDWQHKVGYVQNRSLGDRTSTYCNTHVMGNYCDLYTKREVSSQFLYCDLVTRALTSPIHCSVNKSASLGYPWKEDNPSRRRPRKDKKTGESKPFKPLRSAFEMHSNWLTEFKVVSITDYATVNANVLQQSLRNVDKAFNNFFTKKSGYPNFKKHKDVSFEYPPGASINIIGNRITFPGLGTMRFFKSREIPASWEIRTVTLSRDADGWYVSVLARCETVPDLPIKTLEECQTIQGCDVGINKLVALSDGTIIVNPYFYKKVERRLEIRQRRVSRKQKGSNNRKKAAKRLARTHQKVRRQREDYQWKTGKQIASRADISTFEDLNIKGMKARCQPKKDPITGKYIKNGQAAKAGLNRAISDAAWYSLRQKTEHQAKKLGNLVITVNPKYTSQECPECHHISSGNRDKEKFICTECDYAEDADVNGAINQANRGKTNLGKETLRVVSPKVTPQETSLTLVGEPRNPAKSPVNQRQLRIVTVKSVVVAPKPKARRTQCASSSNWEQLNLFDSRGWDAVESTS